MSGLGDTVAAGLRGAAPYIHLHRGATFVVHVDISGDTRQEARALVEDLALLHSLGVRLVLVYGVRAQVEARMEAEGVVSQYQAGLRVTTQAQLECVLQESARVRTSLEAGFSMGLPNTPSAGAVVHAGSGNFVLARPVGIRDGTDHLHTGCVRRVDTERLSARLHEGGIVLIPPIGYSLTGEAYNLSAVETAAVIAAELKAAKLLYLMHGGLRTPDGGVMPALDLQQAQRLLAAGGTAVTEDAGLWRLQQGVRACSRGVRRVHIIDRDRDNALLLELYSRDGAAAMLSAAPFDELRAAMVDDVGGILALIRPLEEQGLLMRRSLEQLEQRLDRYTVMMRDHTVIACGALRIYAEQNAAEIECLAVHDQYRGHDRGRLLCEALERAAARAGAANIYVLTTGAAHWFLERGFEECDLSALPAARRTEYDAARASKALLKCLQAAPAAHAATS